MLRQLPRPFRPRAVAATLARHCPDLPTSPLRFLGAGDSCVVYEAKHQWVFRFARHERAAAGLRREATLLPRLAGRLGVATPAPQRPMAEADPPFIVYPLLRGPALTRRRYLALAPALRERCAQQVGNFLARLHATPVEFAGACGVQPHLELLNGLPEPCIAALRPRLPTASAARLLRAVSRWLDLPNRTFQPVLLHGDLSPDHVLFDPTEAHVTAVIDFGDMAIGDPAWDFVYIYEDYGVDFLRRALRAYPAREQQHILLARMFRYHVLSAIQSTAGLVQRGSCRAVASLAELDTLLQTHEARFAELVTACTAHDGETTIWPTALAVA